MRLVAVTPAYMDAGSLAGAVLRVTAVAFAAGEAVQGWRGRTSSAGAATGVAARDEWTFRLLFACGILALLVAPVLAPGATLGGDGAAFALGAVATWLGLGLRWWSFAELGESFTFVVRVRADQRVVATGPYRAVRHPGYAGLLLAFGGVGVMLGSWVGLLTSLALLVAALVVRIRAEEAVLVAALGDAYASFARGRARLVPHLW